ncbi:hypothetical protein ACQ4M4_07050 [Leptolyngbya sp. AN02str]|uniref:hypothetical protein n=1 Tax=Leptolyngbya sp. AN02str TaxID=3423363 RepID=UPI003D31590F
MAMSILMPISTFLELAGVASCPIACSNAHQALSSIHGCDRDRSITLLRVGDGRSDGNLPSNRSESRHWL